MIDCGAFFLRSYMQRVLFQKEEKLFGSRRPFGVRKGSDPNLQSTVGIQRQDLHGSGQVPGIDLIAESNAKTGSHHGIGRVHIGRRSANLRADAMGIQKEGVVRFLFRKELDEIVGVQKPEGIDPAFRGRMICGDPCTDAILTDRLKDRDPLPVTDDTEIQLMGLQKSAEFGTGSLHQPDLDSGMKFPKGNDTAGKLRIEYGIS